MRVGKKLTVVETKRTRSCVVRLEKVRAPPVKSKIVKKIRINHEAASSSSGRSSPKGSVTLIQDEKKFKGPIKKRPVTQTATPSPKYKDKYSAVTKTPKLFTEPTTEISLEQTPTVAAGRSRRAIKPNPKYASEDMVTSKIIKNVASATSRTDSPSADKERRISSSSSEDFYNKDTSDDADYGIENIKDDDSDFSDDLELEESSPRPIKRGPGRPRISINVEQIRAETPSLNRKSPTPKPTPIQKPITSRFQQLRKTIAASNAKRLAAANNQTLSPLQAAELAAKKRKLYVSNNDDGDGDSVTKRRKIYIGTNSSKEALSTSLPIQFPLNNKTVIARKSLAPSTTVNGSQITHPDNSAKSQAVLLMEKRHAMLEKAIADRTVTTKGSVKKTFAIRTIHNPIESMQIMPKSEVKPTVGRPRNASPASITLKEKKVDKNVIKPTKSMDCLASTTVDDFETMPTFTIVNINDIINKKGDVLISKANTISKTSTRTPTKDLDCESSGNEEISKEISELENKSNRRKFEASKFQSDKLISARERNAAIHSMSTSTTLTKKPAQTILNHTLSNKNMNKGNPRLSRLSNLPKTMSSTNKPAPRILNSMVAKKMQPVKPLIANLDDSADEAGAGQSLDEEDFGEDGDSEFSPYATKRRTYTKKKLPTQRGTTKENSLAAVKQETASDTKPPRSVVPHKISPEKVVISRQGDKIIKKITCFETWYIINIPEDRPAEVVRNQLELPLIKLANISKKVKLPSSHWSSKVTLFQLSATAMLKSNHVTFTGDLRDHHIPEEDRAKYQPSCVMFRRAVIDRTKCRLPYDRAVIFKNKTFFTNIEGKNVKLVGAPCRINSVSEVEILLQLMDELSLCSNFVEHSSNV